MTSWYSSLLTTTTSRISNLRSTLLASEADGDTEDDTHVCRVLRAYYTEKGRPFPPWLPPDPKAPPPVAPVYASHSQVGSRYGGLVNSGPGGGAGAGGLSSLWDNSPVGQRQDAQSLRQGRGAPPPMRGGGDYQQQQSSRNPFANRGGDARDDIQARPLPSQRAGSYQQAYGRENSSSSTPPPGGGSAQDRLKQRLWGGARTTSPAQSAPFQPPQQQQPQSSRGGYGGGADSYEDRFAPGGMYDGAQGGGGNERPFVAANSPWATNEAEYGGGSSGSGGSRAGGLPSGPRRMGGLPSGPRMR
ncbi:GTPase-activating protein GYP7 [Pleurostoma richardsiae]|uniref:GTPase-activating protein GYP7 n=1 Tax=Pleurostoma richardsiae TaxID=41990 RepID=A0AA38R2T6_9PEZI|nr:GTPase-activating protein GYP7 [Pleurostoma richardsiae]